ncbi:uncharacterized protein LOC132858099 [Tachysurus vachellii]|uniref:uncharacterized protein LOC132858099 n=1 Tax=Tachysurus vachellii TaxID=175792 RepID=UPI00296B4C10|nr:uncharacterized protein LOC132858099 [Tachysurus vachellii]
MDPSPRGQPAHPCRPIRSLPHHPRPSPYPRPVPADVMASYRRFQLLHITRELITCLEQLYSPDLPEHPHLLFHIVRGPPTSTSSSQTPLPNLVDQRTQTDGCPHVEFATLSSGLPYLLLVPQCLMPISVLSVLPWHLLPLILALGLQITFLLLPLIMALDLQTTPLLLPLITKIVYNKPITIPSDSSVHPGSCLPRRCSFLGAAAEDASRAPVEDLSPSTTASLRDPHPGPLRLLRETDCDAVIIGDSIVRHVHATVAKGTWDREQEHRSCGSSCRLEQHQPEAVGDLEEGLQQPNGDSLQHSARRGSCLDRFQYA